MFYLIVGFGGTPGGQIDCYASDLINVMSELESEADLKIISGMISI